MQDLDRSRGDRRLVAMHNVFDSVPIADDCVWLGNFAIDGGDAGLERVSLRETRPPQHPLQHIVGKASAAKWKSHIVLYRAVTKFGGNDFEYLSVEPTTLGHSRIWIPVRRDFA